MNYQVKIVIISPLLLLSLISYTLCAVPLNELYPFGVNNGDNDIKSLNIGGLLTLVHPGSI